MAQTVKVLNSVAALGADATVSNGVLNVVGQRIAIRNILSSTTQAYVAAVLQVNTATPTFANGTVFAYTIVGRSTIDNSIKSWTASVTSAASATATTIVTQLKAKFALFYDIPCTFTGTATLIITGIAGSPEFTSAQDASSAGVIATDATTPVTIGYGAGTLIAAGNVLPISTDTQIVTTNNYTTVTINYLETTAVETRNPTHEGFNQLVLYVNQGDTDYPTLTGTYGTLTQAALGVVATHVTATGTIAVTQTTGAVALAGGGTFSVDAAILPGDIAYPATFAYYPISSILTASTGLTSNTAPASLGAAAFKWVTLRPAV